MKLSLSDFFKEVRTNKKGFIVTRNKNAIYSYFGKNDYDYTDYSEEKNLQEFVLSFLNIGSNVKSYQLDEDSAVLRIGEPQSVIGERKLLENMMNEIKIIPDKKLISSIVGIASNETKTDNIYSPHIQKISELEIILKGIKDKVVHIDDKSLKDLEKKVKTLFKRNKGVLDLQFLEYFNVPGFGMMEEKKDSNIKKRKTINHNFDQVFTILQKNKKLLEKTHEKPSKEEINVIFEKIKTIDMIMLELQTSLED